MPDGTMPDGTLIEVTTSSLLPALDHLLMQQAYNTYKKLLAYSGCWPWQYVFPCNRIAMPTFTNQHNNTAFNGPCK